MRRLLQEEDMKYGEEDLRAGADGLALVGGAAILATALVLLALVDGQADAGRCVPTELHTQDSAC